MSTPLPRYVVFGEALTDMVRQADGSWKISRYIGYESP